MVAEPPSIHCVCVCVCVSGPRCLCLDPVDIHPCIATDCISTALPPHDGRRWCRQHLHAGCLTGRGTRTRTTTLIGRSGALVLVERGARPRVGPGYASASTSGGHRADGHCMRGVGIEEWEGERQHVLRCLREAGGKSERGGGGREKTGGLDGWVGGDVTLGPLASLSRCEIRRRCVVTT